jgi:hypothetical protein
MSPKQKALCAFLNGKSVDVSRYDTSVFVAVDGSEYLVLSEEEADERVKDYIRESVWAFRPEFLAEHLVIEDREAAVRVLEALREQCEDANEPILSMVRDVDALVDDAVSADGRGHFLASYDGAESEEGDFFIYKV